MNEQTKHEYNGYLENVKSESLERRIQSLQQEIVTHRQIIQELERDIDDYCAELKRREMVAKP